MLSHVSWNNRTTFVSVAVHHTVCSVPGADSVEGRGRRRAEEIEEGEGGAKEIEEGEGGAKEIEEGVSHISQNDI